MKITPEYADAVLNSAIEAKNYLAQAAEEVSLNFISSNKEMDKETCLHTVLSNKISNPAAMVMAAKASLKLKF